MRHLIPIAVLVGLVACGGGGSGTPVRPGAATPPPPPLNWTISGQIVDTDSQPISDATLAFASGTAVTTTSGGAWQLQGTGASVHQAVTVTAPGHVTRDTTIRWDAAGRSGVRLDLIADRPPFSMDYYRQLVRNSFEELEGLRPLRRWIRTPSFYLDTRNPRTGAALLASEIADIERAVRESVPQLTGGQFSVGVFEAAEAPFTPRADFIEIVIVYEPESGFCGDALVAANPGRIRINYGDRCRTRCGAFAPEVVAHEVGHAMGFWHTQAQGLMHPTVNVTCGPIRFSDLERHHTRIAYSRPQGNMDPDRDPSTFVAVETANPPHIFCARR